MTGWILVLAVIAMGAGLAIQPLLNARVAIAAGHPVYGALVSVTVSTLSMVVAIVVLRLPPPNFAAFGSLPVWCWFGGVLGVFAVIMALIATPRLGAATTVALVITGQLAASLLLDQYGWLGVPVNPIGVTRVLGVVFLVTGVVLIRWV